MCSKIVFTTLSLVDMSLSQLLSSVVIHLYCDGSAYALLLTLVHACISICLVYALSCNRSFKHEALGSGL